MRTKIHTWRPTYQVCRQLPNGSRQLIASYFTLEEAQIRAKILAVQLAPGASRRQLSLRLCEAWQWQQANGAPRDMVCRGLLLGLERAGHVEFPPVHHVHRNAPTRRKAEQGQAVLGPLDRTPLAVPLSAIRPLDFRPVRRTAEKGAPSMDSTKYIGMDVHKEAISIAVINADGKLVMDAEREQVKSTLSSRSSLLGSWP